MIKREFIKKISTILLCTTIFSNSRVAFATVLDEFNKNILYSELADFNKDGKLDYKDYDILSDYILGKTDSMPYSNGFGLFELGDLNGDYEITSTDQAMLNRYLTGKTEKFTVAERIIVGLSNKSTLLYKGQQLRVPEKIKARMYDGTLKDVDVQWNLDDFNTNNIGEYKVTGIVKGFDKLASLDIIVKDYNPSINIISGIVDGIEKGDKATITIVNDTYIETTETDDKGMYEFNDIPNGDYLVKIDLTGYKLKQTQKVSVHKNKAKKSEYENIGQANFEVEEFSDNRYKYHWEQDETVGGYEEVSNIVNKPKVEFLDEEVIVGDSNASNKLMHNYNIILSDEELSWTQEYSQRLWETIESVPQDNNKKRKPSKWILTDKHIENDVEIKKGIDGDVITISKDSFINATPKIAQVDGIKGKYYSKKLHFAIIRYITDEGTNLSAVEKILNDRFGVTTIVPSYSELTKLTTQEDEGRFQKFKPNELLAIINMFEEMPQGFHVVKGLKYLVRRLDGTPHPLYKDAGAVAWPDAGDESYIEFMDVAFLGSDSDMHRLIIHEKAHFMWSNLFSDDIKNKWIEVGGWYKNDDDKDGWSTTKTTEFVSAYAHAKNPNEDMAESIAYYITNPDKLKSRSINKYNFIRDYIMHGDIYISQIRDDLTFEVFNLYPDYNYPGKIKRVDITVDAQANEDKVVTVEIELNILNKVFDGASEAYTRIYSDIGTFDDMRLKPINEEGSILKGSITIDKHAKSGYWYTDQIIVTDAVGNQRFEGVNDFGWKLYINNEEEDVIKPEYVPNSLKLNLTEEVIEDRIVNKINVSWDVNENKEMKGYNGVYATLINKDTIQDRMEKWSIYDLDNKKANVDFYLTEYMQNGNYGVPYIQMSDKAQNIGDFYFTDSDLDEPMKTVNIVSKNPDSIAPEIDVNKIYIKATPTKPQSPDGETLVEITYYAKDDKSGLGEVSYKLRDPQGISHREYHYHENFRTMFFEGDPTAWKEYKIKVVLPKGSAPGIWGLEEINIMDKAYNRKNYNFTENIHFEVDSQSTYSLEEEIKFEIGNYDSTQGEEITIPVYMNNYSGIGVNNFNFSIKYDNNSLDLIDINAGELLNDSVDFKYNISDNGIAYIKFIDETQGSRNIYGSGNIAYLKFKVNENAKKGEQVITFYNEELRNKDVADTNLTKVNNTTVDGKINITGYAKVDIDLNNTIDMLDLSYVAVNYNKKSTDSSWNGKLDFNNDNIIDIFDLVKVSRYIE